MAWLRRQLTTLVAAAGYRGDDPIVVGLQQYGASPVFLAQGPTSSGEPLAATTLTYAASLSKQMTATCAALLARHGELDMESTLSRWLPSLPPWASRVRLRHLVHHTAALPADSEIDAAAVGDADELGISALIQTPGHLDDGTPIGYAWGTGVRTHAGHRVYRHGGGWTGLRTLLARIPDLDLSLVIIALADNTERRVTLLDNLLDEIVS